MEEGTRSALDLPLTAPPAGEQEGCEQQNNYRRNSECDGEARDDHSRMISRRSGSDAGIALPSPSAVLVGNVGGFVRPRAQNPSLLPYLTLRLPCIVLSCGLQ